MRLTPLDIQNHRFGHRMRGYDPEEVDGFMRMVAEDFETLGREADALRRQVRAQEVRIEELSAQEKALRDTMLTAQQLSEDLKQAAMKEAELRLSEAEVKAEKILDAAHRRLAKLAEDIREMKLLRKRLATAVRTTIETHLALLEGLADELPEDPLLDGKVAFLNPPARRESGGGA